MLKPGQVAYLARDKLNMCSSGIASSSLLEVARLSAYNLFRALSVIGSPVMEIRISMFAFL